MTGAGTQTDPYIPETLTEFIQVCSINGAHISLTHDLNAADDPDYTGELTSPIMLNYVTITSESKCIRGVTVRAANFFNCTGGVSQIGNVFFRDCVHIRTNADAATIEGNYGRAGCGFHQCGIFMEIQCGEYGQLVGSGLGMTETTAVFMLKDTQLYSSSLVANDIAFGKSNVQFIGASVNGTLITGHGSGTAGWSTAAIRFKNAHFYTDSVQLTNCGAYVKDSYVYLETPVLGDFSGVTVQFTDGDNCLAAADGAVTLNCSGAWTAVTTDVLKSPDKLAEIGWIPAIPQCERLTDGFVQGEYLKASGEEYIMLPYVPGEFTRIHAKGSGQALFGAGLRFAITSSPSRNCQVVNYRDEYTFYFTYGYPFGGEYEYDIRQNGELYINGNYFTTMSTTDRGRTPMEMSLFRYVNTDGTAYLNQAVLRYFDAYENGVPAWELVPCVRLEDDAAGMYDKLTGTFFENDGNGKLLTSWRYGENWGQELWACRQNVNDGLPYAIGTMKQEETSENDKPVQMIQYNTPATKYTGTLQGDYKGDLPPATSEYTKMIDAILRDDTLPFPKTETLKSIYALYGGEIELDEPTSRLNAIIQCGVYPDRYTAKTISENEMEVYDNKTGLTKSIFLDNNLEKIWADIVSDGTYIQANLISNDGFFLKSLDGFLLDCIEEV